MPFDFSSPIDPKTLGRVLIQKPGEDLTRRGTDFVSKDDRVVKSLLVHFFRPLLGGVWNEMRLDIVTAESHEPS